MAQPEQSPLPSHAFAANIPTSTAMIDDDGWDISAVQRRESFVRPNAGMVEGAVIKHIRSLLRTPEIATRAMEAARRNDPDIDEQDVVTALGGFDGLMESLFPAEQARIARLLIEGVTVSADGLAVDLRTGGLGSVIREMVSPKQELVA